VKAAVKKKENTFEAFETIRINRRQLKNAPYNPRKITPAAENKLRQFIRKTGFLAPAAIWNKRTGNICGGHQRLKQFDILMKCDDYELTVCAVDLSPEEEVKANIQLNNPGMQGEWDSALLGEIKLSYPEIDFIKDLGFDQPDLDFIFDGEIIDSAPAIADIEPNVQNILKIKEQKKEHREKVNATNRNGESDNIVEYDDYFVTIAFPDNKAKWDFMQSIHKPKDVKYIKPEDLETWRSAPAKKGKKK
jgi:hypothetical protein